MGIISKPTLKNSFLVMGTVVVVAFVCFRSFFGVDMLDESFYIAMAKQVADGGVPVATIWFKAPFYPIFYAWVLPIYKFFTGGYDGLMLFMRICYLIFKAALLITVYRLLCKHLNRYILWLFLAAQFPFNPINVSNFSYNTISQFLLLPCLALIFCSFETNSRNKSMYFAGFAGVLATLVAVAYPPQAVMAVLLAVIISVAIIYLKKPYSILFFYTAAGVVTTMLFLILLLFWGSGLQNFRGGIEYLLNFNGAGASIDSGKAQTLQMFISDIIKPLVSIIGGFVIFFGCFSIEELGYVLYKRL